MEISKISVCQDKKRFISGQNFEFLNCNTSVIKVKRKLTVKIGPEIIT